MSTNEINDIAVKLIEIGGRLGGADGAEVMQLGSKLSSHAADPAHVEPVEEANAPIEEPMIDVESKTPEPPLLPDRPTRPVVAISKVLGVLYPSPNNRPPLVGVNTPSCAKCICEGLLCDGSPVCRNCKGLCLYQLCPKASCTETTCANIHAFQYDLSNPGPLRRVIGDNVKSIVLKRDKEIRFYSPGGHNVGIVPIPSSDTEHEAQPVANNAQFLPPQPPLAYQGQLPNAFPPGGLNPLPMIPFPVPLPVGFPPGYNPMPMNQFSGQPPNAFPPLGHNPMPMNPFPGQPPNVFPPFPPLGFNPMPVNDLPGQQPESISPGGDDAAPTADFPARMSHASPPGGYNLTPMKDEEGNSNQFKASGRRSSRVERTLQSSNSNNINEDDANMIRILNEIRQGIDPKIKAVRNMDGPNIKIEDTDQ